MSLQRATPVILFILSFGLMGCEEGTTSAPTPTEEKQTTTPDDPSRLSGPYVHENLALVLVHGPDRLDGSSIKTLQEALDEKKVRIHETGNVQSLKIENLSASHEIFVPAGTLLKGGRQDRTVATELIVGPEKTLPLASFCVEKNRWGKRQGEDSRFFADCSEVVQLEGRSTAWLLNEGRQEEVWDEVSETQAAFSLSVGSDARDSLSTTSLRLSLDTRDVRNAISAYTEALQGVIDGKKNVVGFATAINGRVVAADVYGSHDLFARLWPPLLRAAAGRAVARKKESSTKTPAKAEFERFLLRLKTQSPTVKAHGASRLEIEARKGLFRFATQNEKGASVHSSAAVE